MRLGDLNIEIVFTGERITMSQLLALAADADRAGFEGIWMAEAFRSSFVPLAAVAGCTSRARLGTNVAQWTRSVPNLELAAADLSELSHGRFHLGLGSSTKDWNENWHGIAYDHPLTRMREYVAALRSLWQASAEHPVSYEGSIFRIRDYLRFNGPWTTRIPIHLAATRPGMAALAGEIADGINFNSMLSPRYIEEVLMPAVDSGAQKAQRSAANLDRGVSAITAVSDDRAEALEWNRHQVAFYCGYTTYFEAVMRLHGFEHDFFAVRELFHSGDLAAAVARVPDEMVEALTLFGTPSEVREKVTRYASICTFVMLSPPSFLLDDGTVLRNQQNMIKAFSEPTTGATP